jgi:putative FmdB family regulatory protein
MMITAYMMTTAYLLATNIFRLGQCCRYNMRFRKLPGREIAMPIYAYRCSSCGLHKDVMQKMSDAPLSTCPECGKETFAKQLTAAGFQLKGSGYYVTDFKNGPKRPESGKAGEVKSDAKTDTAAAPVSSVSTSVTSNPT